MKRLFILAFALLVSGCSVLGIEKPVSYCDNLQPGESVLCDIATDLDVHLETIGDLFIGFDLQGIQDGHFTKEEARSALIKFQSVYQTANFSADDLRLLIMEYTARYPAFILLKRYVGSLQVHKLLKDVDRYILDYHINDHLALIDMVAAD
jgi:hypothetical protein